MAVCYITLFILFGLFISIPQSDVFSDKVMSLTEQKLLLQVAYFIGYLVFGCLLLITVQALHSRLHSSHSLCLNSASLFGLIWVVLMMCSGMIALVGLDQVIAAHSAGSTDASSLYLTVFTLVDALGGGIELVGGLWVLLVSIVALLTGNFSRGFNYFGILVGSLGILTLLQSIPEFKDAFGLTQIIWFIWLGVSLRK